MRQAIVMSGQSIWDIALQYYGSVEAVDWVAKDNGLGLCDYVAPGRSLILRDEVINKQVVDSYISNNIVVSSESDDLHGIGQWAIGINFVIQ